MSIVHGEPKIVVIVGPTASGKSDLAIKLAKKINGEIVSADSRQVYKGMDIGTGKVTRKEMSGVPHYLLDVASPKRTFTVAHYQKLGRAAIKKILKKNKLPIVVGGTGFYIDALLYDYRLPAVKPDTKLRLELEKEPAEKLFARLQKLDPRRAKNIDRRNKRRLIRAIEIAEVTGAPIPPLIRANSGIRKSGYEILKIGINPPSEKLKKKISTRLLKRLKRGMIAEVKKLHASGLSWRRLDNFGLEYRYASRHLRGLITKKEMMDILEKESWRYAKRQMTWWRKDKSIIWVEEPRYAMPLVKNFCEKRNLPPKERGSRSM